MSNAKPPLVSLADIPARRTEWLFEPYIARGRLTLLDGDPGIGKSFVAIDLAARLSRGLPLPSGQVPERPGTTLYFTTEDQADDTIRPRAEAAGADLSRIIVETPERFGPLLRLPRDSSRLWQYIHDHRADLVVFDPLSAFLQDGISMNVDTSIRKVLTPLGYVAARSNSAMMAHRHLNKAGGARALYRGIGSIGLTAAGRSELLIAEHPDDPDLHVLAHAKSNGPIGPSLGFRLVADDQGRHRIEWTGRVDLTANELCACRRPVAERPRERAAEWLKKELAGGPRPASELFAAAAKAGITERTLERARKDMQVVSTREVDGGSVRGWIWSDLAEGDEPFVLTSPPGWPSPPVRDERPIELPGLGLEGTRSVEEMLDRLRENR
jgi:hypothetical protein